MAISIMHESSDYRTAYLVRVEPFEEIHSLLEEINHLFLPRVVGVALRI